MTQTMRYALPLLQSGQAQKEITHNEAIGRIDALVHLAVDTRRSVPPIAVDGAAWIVGPSPSVEWSDKVGQIAIFDDSGWSAIVPRDGCIAFVRDEGVFIHFAAGAWRDGWPVPSLEVRGRPVLASAAAAVTPPSGGTVIDVEARATLAQLLGALQGSGLIAAG